MSWLLENPVMISIIGVVAAIVLGVAWLQTGKHTILYGIVAVLVFTLVGLVIERMVETDTEAVEGLLTQIARDVQQNDIQAILAHIDPSATFVRAQAEGELPKYKFSEVNIKSNLTITFDNPSDPTEAVTKFNVVVAGSHRDGSIEMWRVPRYAIVTFRKSGERWKVVAYEHHDPQEGLMRNRVQE